MKHPLAQPRNSFFPKFLMLRAFSAIAALSMGLNHGLFAQDATVPPPGRYTNAELRRLWKPVADTVFLQEIGQKVPTSKPATAVAVYKDKVYVVVGGTLQQLQEGTLKLRWMKWTRRCARLPGKYGP